MTNDERWVITLYQRYVELYGDPIERPIDPRNPAGEDRSASHEPSPTSR